jgi:mannobiose 2-epimerase
MNASPLPLLLASLLVPLGATIAAPPPEDFPAQARQFRQQLIEKIMPYWHDTAIDKQNGGYALSDDFVRGRTPPTEKQLVTQARMVWTFSLAHRKGYGDATRNYLKDAETGYRFLLEHFLDQENGGYCWKTTPAGKVTNDKKIIYGQSFVIYALVEYHRATGDREPLNRAMDLYRVLQKRSHDGKFGGWVEHFTRDWEPILDRNVPAEVEICGLKSANTHLHLMEALTELYEASKDSAVKKSLQEAVRLNATYFYPKIAGKAAFHRNPNWSEVTDPRSAGLSYGHNVEFAWLMIRAQQVLRQKPAWDHFQAHLDHALKYGYDHERGGLYNRGADDQPATDTSKVWWVQAEMLAALSYAEKNTPKPEYAKALASLLDFVQKYQADPTDGIWLDTVTADGKPKATGKAHSWKANYHDVRTIDLFIDAFAK